MCRLALSITLLFAFCLPSNGFRKVKKHDGSGGGLQTMQSALIDQTSNSTGWGKPPLWWPPYVANARWGSDWRQVTHSEGPTFQCYGRAAYGRGFRHGFGEGWAYHDMSGETCCGHWCGFGYDPSKGNHDKQCWCRDLTCTTSGEKPKLNNGRFECVGIRKVDVCVKAIFETDGKSRGHILEYFEKGTHTSRSMEQTVQHRFQVQAKAAYNNVLWSVEGNTEYQLDHLTQSSFAETRHSMQKREVKIYLDRPAYWYQSQITITLTDWSSINMKGPWKILGAPLDLKQSCIHYQI